MSFGEWLGVLGVGVGALGILLAYYFYRKSARTKLLAVSYTSPIPLMLPLLDVTVYYKETAQKALSRVFLLFWNRGSAAIETADFISPIDFRGNGKVLSVQIHEKDAAANVILDDANTGIEIKLLRPGEAVIAQIDAGVESFKLDLSIDMKSADMSATIEGYKTLVAPVSGAVIALIGAIVFFMTVPFPEGYLSDYGGTAWEFIVLIGYMFLGLGTGMGTGFFSSWALRRIIKARMSPVAWRFFEMQLSALGAQSTWEKLKAEVDEIIKR